MFIKIFHKPIPLAYSLTFPPKKKKWEGNHWRFNYACEQCWAEFNRIFILSLY